jgi:hypothetical protein
LIHSNSKKSSIEITYTKLKWSVRKILVWESSNFEPELQAKYPDIRAYAGVGITDPTASLNLVCRHKECKL